MRDFDSFEAFGAFWEFAVIPGYLLAMHAALDECGAAVKERIQEKIGVSQGPSHGYPGWAPLADTTLHGWGPNPGKIALGQTGRRSGEDPLMATGKSRDEIEYVVHRNDLAVTIGSNSDGLFYAEFGTVNEPPRPTFRPAAEEIVEEVMLARIGEFAVAGITGIGIRTLYTSAQLSNFGTGREYVNTSRASFRGFARGMGMRSRF